MAEISVPGATLASFYEAARIELLKFERSEREFRKRDQEERARALKLPLDNPYPN